MGDLIVLENLCEFLRYNWLVQSRIDLSVGAHILTPSACTIYATPKLADGDDSYEDYKKKKRI